MNPIVNRNKKGGKKAFFKAKLNYKNGESSRHSLQKKQANEKRTNYRVNQTRQGKQR